MLYQAFGLWRRALSPWAIAVGSAHRVVTHPSNPITKTRLGRVQAACLESTHRLIKRYPKQGFGFDGLDPGGGPKPIRETVVRKKAFCDLLHFDSGAAADTPRVLFVTALAGHHASLARDTVKEFLVDHDVYVTDWIDARQVSVSEGKFGFEDYVKYLIEFIELLGPDTHVVGLCQAAVPTLVAIAVMSERQNPARPLSVSLLAGPIDISANPGKVTQYADRLNLALICAAAVHRVPAGYPGVGRLVCPGSLQLVGFIAMNARSHLEAHWRFFKSVAQGRVELADEHRDFYDDYLSTMDATAEFFTETLECVFLERQLPRRRMTCDGEIVDCAAIRDIALLTLEGEKDDMIAPGVTQAAHGLCRNLPDELREHYVQPNVGHYEVFCGSRYRDEVAPRIKAFIARHGTRSVARCQHGI